MKRVMEKSMVLDQGAPTPIYFLMGAGLDQKLHVAGDLAEKLNLTEEVKAFVFVLVLDSDDF